MVRLVALSQHRLHSGGGAPARALYSHCRAHTRRRRESERQPMTRLVPGLDLDPCGQRDCAHGRSKRAAVVGAAASRGERFITLPFASVMPSIFASLIRPTTWDSRSIRPWLAHETPTCSPKQMLVQFL